jgi:hypothetical protein
MSTIHVQQIKAYLHTTFDSLIDISDYDGQPAEERESAFLTRALAAFCIMHLANTSPEDAACSVTDGGQDNGIDAIYFHDQERILYLVQSKWKHDGSGSVARGDIQKFITGFKDLINARFDRFNAKVNGRRDHIEKAIKNADSRFIIVVAYTGQDPLAIEQQRDLDDLLAEMNDTSEILNLQVLKQSRLHQIISAGAIGSPIDIEVAIREWGQVRDPFTAFYGQVSAKDIASWYELHPRLFAQDIRLYLGSTDVNTGLMDTLRNHPERFWYLNNGITVVCQSIRKKPIGGSDRECGFFECKGISVVNGAQTVGAISSTNARNPGFTEKASVFVKFVSLEHCPEGFSIEVTRATNTQNRIERRDFVALDPEQERIQREALLDGIQYVYKPGDRVTDKTKGFDFGEAAVAMACSLPDVGFAVQAKREVGKLWDDITKPPYTRLFNSGTTGTLLWFRTQILRSIDAALAGPQPLLVVNRDKLFPIHGNRFVAHVVFQKLNKLGLSSPNGHSLEDAKKQIPDLVSAALSSVAKETNSQYPDSYLAVLFKNLPKCKAILKALQEVPAQATLPQGQLFE